jgi:hypothetical protein
MRNVWWRLPVEREETRSVWLKKFLRAVALLYAVKARVLPSTLVAPGT